MTDVTDLTDRAVALARDGEVEAALAELWSTDRFRRQAAYAYAARRRRDPGMGDALALLELAEVARQRRAFRGVVWWEHPVALFMLLVGVNVLNLTLTTGRVAGVVTGLGVGAVFGVLTLIGLGWVRRRAARVPAGPVADTGPGLVSEYATQLLEAAETDDETDGEAEVLARARAVPTNDVQRLLMIAGAAHGARLAVMEFAPRRRRLRGALDPVRVQLVTDWRGTGRELPTPHHRRQPDLA